VSLGTVRVGDDGLDTFLLSTRDNLPNVRFDTNSPTPMSARALENTMRGLADADETGNLGLGIENLSGEGESLMSVSLFDVSHRAGLGCCGGEVGELGRFCTLAPGDCTTGKHVDNKASLKPFHVYMRVGLGPGGRRAKNVAEIGWCVPTETFGDHKA
jgi:hypothetical protein